MKNLTILQRRQLKRVVIKTKNQIKKFSDWNDQNIYLCFSDLVFRIFVEKNGFDFAVFKEKFPQLFSKDCPINLKSIVNYEFSKLSDDIFTSNDGFFWIKQYWQSDYKKNIVQQGKIENNKIHIITQLFTESYIVEFIADNILGSIFYNKYKSELSSTKLQKELKLNFQYLRLNNPADFFFEVPKSLKSFENLKIFDPSCGNGLFPVFFLRKLVFLRAKIEKITLFNATIRVIEENLFGFDIDPIAINETKKALILEVAKISNKIPNFNLKFHFFSPFPFSENSSKFNITTLNPQIIQKYNYNLDLLNKLTVLGSLLKPKYFEDDEIKKLKHLNLPITQELIEISNLLSRKYDVITTNFPFLAKNKQNEILRNYSQKYYPDSHLDLATVFLERSFDFCNPTGAMAVVLPQNFLFLSNYEHLRRKLLNQYGLSSIALLGKKAFNTNLWDFNTQILFASLHSENHNISFIDASNSNKTSHKPRLLKNEKVHKIHKKSILKNEKTTISYYQTQQFSSLLSDVADSFQGLMFKDKVRLTRYFWEVPQITKNYKFMLSSFNKNDVFSGRSKILLWKEFLENFKQVGGNYKWNSSWGKRGVGVSQMNNLTRGIYTGEIFDGNIDIIIPKHQKYEKAIINYVFSDEYIKNLRLLDPKLDVNTSSLIKVPFDFEKYETPSSKKYLYIYSNDPTQYVFHGHPIKRCVFDENTNTTKYGSNRIDTIALQIALIKYLGYVYPAEILDLKGFSLVQSKITKQSKNLRTYQAKDGILLLHQFDNVVLEDHPLYTFFTKVFDNDKSKTHNFFKTIGINNLNNWLRNRFFKEHLKLFKQRPFIWHIWDGLPNGFSVLINYHKLNRKMLKNIITKYLQDWISNKNLSPTQKAASLTLQEELNKIYLGDTPYDIFVRWKSLDKQPIGWNPDFNDGIRLNIRPFMLAKDVKLKDAGILRYKPHINWNKDRGKDHKSSFWYELGRLYNEPRGSRINAHHLILNQKLTSNNKKTSH